MLRYPSTQKSEWTESALVCDAILNMRDKLLGSPKDDLVACSGQLPRGAVSAGIIDSLSLLFSHTHLRPLSDLPGRDEGWLRTPQRVHCRMVRR